MIKFYKETEDGELSIDAGSIECENEGNRSDPLDWYISYAEWEDGTELTDEEIRKLEEAYPTIPDDMVEYDRDMEDDRRYESWKDERY